MKIPRLIATIAASAVIFLCALGVGPTSATQSVTTPPSNSTASLPKAAAPIPARIPHSVSRDNAKEMALNYLDYTAFSRTGLIKQLQYEGFSLADATYGTDATRANWLKQAARMAAAYLDYSAFSRSGLIAQLKYEGFTTAQATYGARSVGL